MQRRRNQGFERAGAFGARQLGLPAVRAREMDLALNWRRAVGEPLARLVRAVRVRRGVLELQLLAPDTDPTGAIEDRLPRLGRRLVELCPRLGVRSVRLLPHGDGRPPQARPIAAESPASAPDQKP